MRRQPEAQRRCRLKWFGLDPKAYARLGAAVLAAADEPRTSAELRAAVGAGKELTPAAALERVYDVRGDGLGAVLLGGRVLGARGSRKAGRDLEIALDLVRRPSAKLRRRLAERFEELAAPLGARGIRGPELGPVAQKSR